MSNVTRSIRRFFTTKALMEEEICFLEDYADGFSRDLDYAETALREERNWVDSLLKEVIDRDQQIANLQAELSESNSKLVNVKATVRELYTELTYGWEDEEVTQPLDQDHWAADHDVWACATCYERTFSDVPF